MRLLRVLLTIACACMLMPAHAQRVVRLTNGEFLPYLSQHLPHHGLASRIVSAAFALQGVQVEYGFFPWNRSLALAQAGEWDGSAVWLRSAEREKDFHISDPVVQIEYVFFHLKETAFDWHTLRDLGAYRVGVTQNYFYGQDFLDALRRGDFSAESVASDEQNLRKLLHKRIDVFPMDRIAALATINQRLSEQEASRLAYHPRPFAKDALCLLLSRRVPAGEQLIREFNLGLQKLRASGAYDRFMKEALERRAQR